MTQRAIEEHFLESRDKMTSFAKQRLGCVFDAEDSVQNTYLRVIEYWEKYNTDKPLHNWVKVIFRNEIKKVARSVRLGGLSELDELLVEGDFDDAIERGLFHKRFNKEKNKDILMLHYVKGYTPAEVSDLVGVGLWGVYKVLSRFKESTEGGKGGGNGGK